MFSSRSMSLLTTALVAFLSSSPDTQVAAAPAPVPAREVRQASGSSYWLQNINAAGTVWGGPDASSYKVFRNVLEIDPSIDTTGGSDVSDAINAIIADGSRCGQGCESSTTLPAIIYLPAGTYRLDKPLTMYYMTQLVGDATNRPILKAGPNFAGIAVLDSDPYEAGGANWYINQNNFFRQVRNLVIDLTGSTDAATGIHWQVAQATSLQNLDFKMTPGSQQQGIFMDNGSGGFFSDLTFEGGKYGAFLGNQQFTSRNLVFTNVDTAIYMNWNWGWTLSNISISGGTTGIDMSASPANQTVGSVLLSDSKISGPTYGIKTAFGGSNNVPTTGGTLVLDNVEFDNVANPVYQDVSNSVLLSTSGVIASWATGNGYDNSATATMNPGSTIKSPTKAQSLLNAGGQIFGRSKPQYEDLDASSFVLAMKDGGCKGDGTTDDTAALQAFLQSASDNGKVAYFEHGAYLVTDTIKVPKNIKMTGEIWPLIVANGPSFNDASSPKPVFQVGQNGDQGAVEISDLIFETKGPAPGAIMIEWNLNSAQGDSGMWDTHVRIGGSYGTELTSNECGSNPGLEVTDPTISAVTSCTGVFLMFHATTSSSGVYLENDWFWVADHDLEVNNQTQISIYSGRGALFESQGPIWLWGTAAEHSILYNYQLQGVQAFFGGFMQSETPYFQPNPASPSPWTVDSTFNDPSFDNCPASGVSADGVACKDAWGLRVVNSSGVLVYSTGMYSFFDNYGQACVGDNNCQENMISIENSDVFMYTVTTKAAINMISDSRYSSSSILGANNHNNFGDTLSYYFTYAS